MNSTGPKISIRDTAPKAELLAHVDDAVLGESLSKSTVIVLPQCELEGKHLFQPETKEVFEYLRDHIPAEFRVEIAASDDQYIEKALHGAEIWLPTVFLVASDPNVVAVTLNVLSNYIYERLKGLLTRDIRVHSTVVLDLKKKTVSIEYEGPADAYVSVVSEALSKLPGSDGV
jgi:hypothetical protein